MASCRHRRPLRSHGQLRRADRQRRGGQSPRPHPHRPRPSHDLGVTPHLVAVSTCYVAGNRRGQRADEELLTESPFHIDVDWHAEVDASPTGPLRLRCRIPHRADRLGEFRSRGPQRTGRRRSAAVVGQDRATPSAAGWTTNSSKRAGPGPLRSAGPMPMPTPRRSGSGRWMESKGEVPGLARASLDHRVGVVGAVPRVDQGLPYGRADHHQLRAVGLLKEFPGVPEGIIDVIPVDLVVAAIINVAAKADGRQDRRLGSASRRDHPGGVRAPGIRCATAAWSTWSVGVVHREPAL